MDTVDTTERRRTPLARHFLTASSAILGVTLAGIAAFTGTYALWVDEKPLNAAPIEAGSLALLVNESSSVTLSAADFAGMLPGDRRTRTVMLHADGTVQTSITAQAAMANTDYEIRVADGACSGAALTGSSTTAGAQVVGERSIGESAPACVEVHLLPGAGAASEAAAAAFTITFTATQIVD